VGEINWRGLVWKEEAPPRVGEIKWRGLVWFGRRGLHHVGEIKWRCLVWKEEAPPRVGEVKWRGLVWKEEAPPRGINNMARFGLEGGGSATWEKENGAVWCGGSWHKGGMRKGCKRGIRRDRTNMLTVPLVRRMSTPFS
jgi:hypothetical protein